ncbi:helix-turn-helix domain-containing protein [Acetobacter oeni]|uniref:Uncharacterized protein n=1 Tax=Acetobacter oeni TaxID=304077 RepID=A0A511XJP1_9PROT|nr:hypothetical protein [Acetobacter oeni]MBB3883388.1 hypothetical protein [Acetobacter oeni]NHO19367.1 hypothetical protein [Acetobacter oeni]GBR03925.1 hypothetical protein AA21952_1227 [Acetobacter oeni LMG 21952]GEN63170.1 hypothetical protein AOE01nite_13940 [Acetobacter oeni]
MKQGMLKPGMVDVFGVLPHIKRRIKDIYGTQRNFAKAIGVTDSHLSDALCGRSGYPKGMLPKLGIRQKTYFEIMDIPTGVGARGSE